MKYYFTLVILLAGFYSYCQVDTLKNDGIVKLIKSGLSKEIVLKKIRTSPHVKFDLSADGLVNLKTNKVPDSVILIMMDRYEFQNTASTVSTAQIKSNTKKQKAMNVEIAEKEVEEDIVQDNFEKIFSLSAIKTPGIYYFDSKAKEYILLAHKDKVLVSSRTNIGMSLVTMGAAGQTQIIVPNQKSLLQIKNRRPVFYVKANANESQSVGNVINPTELLLYKALVKKEARIIPLATQVMGIPNNKRKKKNTDIPNLERVNNTLTKLTFDKQLFSGAYFIAPNSFVSMYLPFYYEFDIKD